MKDSRVFQRAKEAVDLRRIVRLEGQKSSGRYVVGICPFHDDNSPSLMVFRDGWRCLAASCPHSNGSVIDWILLSRDMPLTGGNAYKIAKELLSEDNDLVKLSKFSNELFEDKVAPKILQSSNPAHNYARNLEFDEDGQEYFRGRGLSDWMVKSLWLGWVSTIAVIPVWECFPGRSRLLTLRFRDTLKNGHGYYGIKDHNAPLLFNSWVIERAVHLQTSEIYVFYGEFDSALAVQCGIFAVSPTNGCRAFNPDWVDDFDGEIIFVPDRTPGEDDAAYKDAQRVGLRGSIEELPDIPGKDFTEQFLSAPEDYLSNFHTDERLPSFLKGWCSYEDKRL